MDFEPKKFSDIVDEMQNRITGLDDFQVGSVTRTLIESFSYEIGLMYQKMNLVYLSAFIDTADGINLEKVVGVLGITRGEPDYSTGTVTFERDRGNDDILIPLGSLVATEDKPDSPKKMYQTIEEKTLHGTDLTIDIKIQAKERGKEQDAPEGSINVMPRPIPGIKSVTNKEKVQLTGKQRETDDELRERAKNTLISAGKATMLSIENALLSQPGVWDVKVREDFLFPQGTATLTRRPTITGDLIVPRQSRISATVNSQVRVLRTKSEILIKDGNNDTVVALEAELEGKAGEIIQAAANSSMWSFMDKDNEDKLIISNMSSIALSEFGVIDVFTDGPDLTKPDELSRIRGVIDNVKGAGIYVRLESAQPVKVYGIFRIDASSSQNLNANDQSQLENAVAGTIRDFLNQTKMGEPLLFSRLMKEVISAEGVENLAGFIISVETVRSQGQREDFKMDQNKIEIEESERFKPVEICVAASDKSLLVDAEMQADVLDTDKITSLKNAMTIYADNLGQGKPFMITDPSNNDLFTAMHIPGITIQPESIKLTPHPWCSRSNLFLLNNADPPKVTGINVSFVEKAAAGVLFAYSSFLEITGALNIKLDESDLQEDKDNIIAHAIKAVNTYLDDLGPEEDIVLNDLAGRAKSVPGVIDTTWVIDDFRAELTNDGIITPMPNRIKVDKIGVDPFEKARLKKNAFCVTYRTEKVIIQVTKLTLKLQKPVSDDIKSTLSTLTVNIINHFLDTYQPGENLNFNDLRIAIENRLPAAPAIVESLEVFASSEGDGRNQVASLTNPLNIHIRSVELAQMVPFDPDILILSE